MRLETYIIHGKPSDLRALFKDVECLGWQITYKEDKRIKAGERWWWTAAKVGQITGEDDEVTLKTRLRRGSLDATISLNFLGEKSDLSELFKSLAASWRLCFLGYDGGWGGEPHLRLRSRPKTS